jgi:sulfoxide reductase heme-binding subunit YedZ
MQSKANVSQAVLMAGFFVWLMLWRAIPARWQANVAALLALAVVSAIGTAFLEYAWYATATHVPAIRVLMANLSLRIGPRPAVWVGMVGLAIAAAVGVRQGLARVLQPAT